MRKIFVAFFIFHNAFCVFGQKKTVALGNDLVFSNSVKKWFSAWKLLSKDIYKINKVRPVVFVFFDEKYVYSNSTITIKKGDIVNGPNLMNLKLKWKKKLHKHSITLPDNSVVSVCLMSFAAKISTKSNKSFFVMPLPSFWKKSGVSNKGLSLEDLITGIFIHEFTHSQQMQNFGKEMDEYEQQTNFGVEFSDDIVQNIFCKNTDYLKLYKNEIALFYGSLKNKNLDKKIVHDGMAMMRKRQKFFL